MLYKNEREIRILRISFAGLCKKIRKKIMILVLTKSYFINNVI